MFYLVGQREPKQSTVVCSLVSEWLIEIKFQSTTFLTRLFVLFRNVHYLSVILTSAFTSSLSLLLSFEHKCCMRTRARILHSPHRCKALQLCPHPSGSRAADVVPALQPPGGSARAGAASRPRAVPPPLERCGRLCRASCGGNGGAEPEREFLRPCSLWLFPCTRPCSENTRKYNRLSVYKSLRSFSWRIGGS